MKTTQSKTTHITRLLSIGAISLICGLGNAQAQSVEEIRWKSESQVRALYGEPESATPPVGTHASYTLWKYANFTVAFANSRAFHLFSSNSLDKMELEEDRPEN